MMDGKVEMRMVFGFSSLTNVSVCILYMARTGYIVGAQNT